MMNNQHSPDSLNVPDLVKAENISKRFGGTIALESASFRCARGSIHALLGENGAGKSTLVKTLAGVVMPDAGMISLNGQPITIQSPTEAAQVGIVPVFQELSLMPHLTVAENIFITNAPRNRLGMIRRKHLNQQTEELFSGLHLHSIDPNALVGELPLAFRQLVEIAKALARSPQLLIMDEGTSALSIQDVRVVFDIMRSLREQGKSVVFISHRMSEVKEIADTLTIFRDGHDVGSFPMGSVSESEMVQLMIGRKLEQVFPPKSVVSQAQPVALEVKDLHWEDKLHNINLSVGKGEIVGLGGLDGQGQGDLLLALFGLLRGMRGHVLIEGKQVNITSPASAAQMGIQMALIPEDRKTEGLILPMSVADNASLTTIDRVAKWGLIDRKQEQATVKHIIEQMQVKTSSPNARVRNLSGGNQQKVVIGKWLQTKAKIYLLHDLTRGIDVATKQEIYHLIRRMADDGAAILFFSTELAELVGMCDRVLVLYEGHIFRELKGAEITEENIVTAALGLESQSAVVHEAGR